MAISKVVYGGNTLVDLTSDTVTPETLLEGVTAHDKSGALIVGTMVQYTPLDAYPVGSVYISEEPISPSLLFGGTWTQISDRFLLAAGSTYTAGSTGGSATHTLTIDEMPNHNHQIAIRHSDGTRTNGEVLNCGLQANVSDGRWRANPKASGGGAAHNNMPPYEAYYMWKRTA